MANVFVDTSFVVALVNQKDQNHSLAIELAENFAGQGLVTTDAILLEIGNALSRNFKKQSVKIIELFLTLNDVKVIHLHLLFSEKHLISTGHIQASSGDCLTAFRLLS